MMTRIGSATFAHMDPADLVRHLDHEGSEEERQRWDQHLAGCGPCAHDARTLRQRSEVLTMWLEHADFEADVVLDVPQVAPAASAARGTPSPWLRAAAILLLLAAPLAAIQPVREWVADRIGLTQDEPAGTAAQAAAPDVIRFVPSPGSFTVHMPPVAGATLTLRRAAGHEAVLQSADTGTHGPLVSGDLLRLDHAADSEPRWVLRLPATVSDVVVTVGADRLRISGEQIDGGRVVRSQEVSAAAGRVVDP